MGSGGLGDVMVFDMSDGRGNSKAKKGPAGKKRPQWGEQRAAKQAANDEPVEILVSDKDRQRMAD